MRSFSLLIGQAVWAACQAGVIFFLSGRHQGISLVGSLTFALAVFSPLCLLGSLNTRNLVAIGRAKTVSLFRDVCMRIAVVLVAMLAAAIVLSLTEKFRQFTYLTLLLLVMRGADQLSDVSAGYYQKHNKTTRLVCSYCGRGLISLGSLVMTYILSSSLAIAICVAAASTLAFVGWFDVVVPLKFLPRESMVGPTEIKGNKIGGSVKLFPFIDSLHANSLRLTVGAVFPAEVVGIFGVVQTAFAPVQILVSSLALSNLRKLADLSSSSNEKFRKLLNRLSLLSFFSVVAFGLFWFIVSERLVEGIFPFLSASEIKSSGILFALSMLLFGPVGFYAQAVLIKRKDKIYGVSPMTGLAFFCIFVGAAKIGLFAAGLFGVCFCFMLSNALRALICYVVVQRSSN